MGVILWGGDNTACKIFFWRIAAVKAVEAAVEGAEVPAAGLCSPSTFMLLVSLRVVPGTQGSVLCVITRHNAVPPV